MGRNMFTPGRGAWDPDWRGYWGDDPPYHAPVFVLTHHEREPVPMDGGTTFHFVTDGAESAMARAREAAGDRDVSIAGGAETLNQYLARARSTSYGCTWCRSLPVTPARGCSPASRRPTSRSPACGTRRTSPT